MKRGLFVISAIVLVGLLILTPLLWLRSRHTADRLHGRIWGKTSFIAASKEGRLTVVVFGWDGARNFQWGIHTDPVNDEMSFPFGPVQQYVSAWGFGTIDRPIYHVMRSSYQTPEGETVYLWGAATATLMGSGIIVPYWFLTLAMAVLCAGVVYRSGLLRRWIRSRPGLCLICGYDLRASKDRCPECGTAIPPQTTAEGAST